MPNRRIEQASELRKLRLKKKRAAREAKDPNYHKRIAKQRQASRDEADRRTCGTGKPETLSQFAHRIGMPEIAKVLKLDEERNGEQ